MMEHTHRAMPASILKPCAALTEIILGTALTAMAFGLFILPQHFAAAGVTGFASLISEYLPISLSQTVLILNLLFLALGFLFVGKAFTAKTVASSLMFPLFLQAFSRGEALCAENSLVSMLIAGTLLGTGTGLILRSGASSGGFCVLGVLLQNKWHFPISAALHVIDASVILMQAFRQPLLQTVYGILVITFSAFWVELIASPGKCAPRVFRGLLESPYRKVSD